VICVRTVAVAVRFGSGDGKRRVRRRGRARLVFFLFQQLEWEGWAVVMLVMVLMVELIITSFHYGMKICGNFSNGFSFPLFIFYEKRLNIY
jgi:hypothetical protein